MLRPGDALGQRSRSKGTALHLMPAGRDYRLNRFHPGGTNNARAPSLNCCRADGSRRGLPASGRLLRNVGSGTGRKPDQLGASAMV